MSAFLTWEPDKWAYEKLQERLNAYASGKAVTSDAFSVRVSHYNCEDYVWRYVKKDNKTQEIK